VRRADGRGDAISTAGLHATTGCRDLPAALPARGDLAADANSLLGGVGFREQCGERILGAPTSAAPDVKQPAATTRSRLTTARQFRAPP
jgi:hypothetical protein